MPADGPRVLYQHQLYKGPKKRTRPRTPRRPQLTVDQILAWADAYHEETGRWPNVASGPVGRTIDETWIRLDDALRHGLRGLPKGLSLARVLAEHRDVRNWRNLPPLCEKQILDWVDAYHRRTGRWPSQQTGGVIPEASGEYGGEKWSAVSNALRFGTRGLPGGASLARFLEKHRGVRNRRDLVNNVLIQGLRGLPSGLSLAQVLNRHRGVRNIQTLQPLREKEIILWARRHHQQTGQWPQVRSGPIADAPGETWSGVDQALRVGNRGLPGGSTLPTVLSKYCGVRNSRALPDLSKRDILAWIDQHRQSAGRWPNRNSGPVMTAPGETWSCIDSALKVVQRGWPGGYSLARLLLEHRNVCFRKRRVGLMTLQLIISWAKRHHARTGTWPTLRSGAIATTVGETWRGVDRALHDGYRGLPGGSSLAKLIDQYCRKSK